MDSPALRKNTVELLALMVERYPNLTIGQIIGNATPVDGLYHVSDADFAYRLNHLFGTYTQFEAAGIKP